MTDETHKEKRQGDKARATMNSACRTFLRKCGPHTTNPMLFTHLVEVAEKDFNLKFDGPVDLSDVCFIRQTQEGQAEVKMSAKMRRKEGRKKKYQLTTEGEVVKKVIEEHNLQE